MRSIDDPHVLCDIIDMVTLKCKGIRETVQLPSVPRPSLCVITTHCTTYSHAANTEERGTSRRSQGLATSSLLQSLQFFESSILSLYLYKFRAQYQSLSLNSCWHRINYFTIYEICTVGNTCYLGSLYCAWQSYPGIHICSLRSFGILFPWQCISL